MIDRWQEERGGAERALFDFARHLVARGHEVHAFAGHGPARGQDPVAIFHRVRSHAWSRVGRERRLARALEAAALEAGCERTLGIRHLEHVDLFWPHGGSHQATLAALERAARGRRRTVDPLRPRGRHALFVELERKLAEDGGARAIACPSTLVRDEFAERYPEASTRLHLAPNGVDLQRFHPRERLGARARLRTRFGLHASTPILVFAATNPVLKGLPELVHALHGLLRMSWFLVVAGPRQERRWTRALARHGLDVKRARVVRHLDAVELAAGADVCVEVRQVQARHEVPHRTSPMVLRQQRIEVARVQHHLRPVGTLQPRRRTTYLTRLHLTRHRRRS